MIQQQWYIWKNRAERFVLRIFTEDTKNTGPTDEDRYYLHSHCGTFTRLHWCPCLPGRTFSFIISGEVRLSSGFHNRLRRLVVIRLDGGWRNMCPSLLLLRLKYRSSYCRLPSETHVAEPVLNGLHNSYLYWFGSQIPKRGWKNEYLACHNRYPWI